MIIYARELKPGDMFLADPIGIAPINRENMKFDLYFIVDAKKVGKTSIAKYELKVLRMDYNGSPSIFSLSAKRDEIFSRGCIPLRFQEMGLYLSDPIPEYSE